jgi:hypothetical protein
MIYQNLHFFVEASFKVNPTSRVSKLKNELFHNKRQLKKGYFAKGIDLSEVLSQRKRPF